MRGSTSEESGGGESTADLTAAVARGEPAAFARFYEAWFDRAFALARAITRKDESFCLDVVQDCMLRVARTLKPLADERALSSWMGQALMTTAVDRIRQEDRRARRERSVALPESAAAPDAGLPLEDEERNAWVLAQLALLPVADRSLFSARFSEGKTLDAAGAAVGISGDAAHGKIWRILGRLRKSAAEHFHD